VHSLAGARTSPPAPDGAGARGDRVIVRVVDRGPGIPPAQLERVFEPFYRAGTHSGGHRGSGLGLAIARGFTEANSGSLHVESLPGQGAAFVFELPLEERAAGVEGEQPEAQSGQPERERAADAPLLAASAARAGASARARDSGG
jgi:hypothetical protein